MLYRILPTPDELGDSPELASLVTLTINLEMASFALLAAYPDLDFDYDARSSYTEQDAYVYAMISQIRALEGVVEEYLESIRRLRSLRKSNSGGTQVSF